MPETPENRVERIVSGLLRGRRLKLRGGDAEARDAIIMAARLAAARQGPQRMNPGFRQRLADELEAAPRQGWLTRRAALVAGVGALAGAIGGGLAVRGLQEARPSTAGRLIKPTTGQWTAVSAPRCGGNSSAQASWRSIDWKGAGSTASSTTSLRCRRSCSGRSRRSGARGRRPS